MKKTIISLVFLVILAGIICGYCTLMSTYDPMYPDIKYRIRHLLRQADDIESISVGNSHCKAIDFKALEMRGYHTWQGGNDVFETEHQLKVFIPRLPHVRTVFYVISYGSFHADNRAATIFDRKAKRVESYVYLPGWTWIEGDFNSFVKAKLVNLIRPDHGYAPLLRILGLKQKPFIESDPYDGSRIGKRQYRGYADINVLIERAESTRIVKHKNLIRNMMQNHPGLSNDSYDTLVRTINYLQQRDIRIVFFTPPYFFRYTELNDQSMVKECRNAMHKLVAEHGVEYYDFSTDPDFIFDNTFFMDEDHLNRKKGAPAFSRKFKKIINKNDNPPDGIQNSRSP